VSGGSGLLPAERPGGGQDTEDEGTAEDKALRAAAEKIKELTEKGGGFEDLREQIRIELTAEGLRIEMTERDGQPFFEVGSAVLIHPLKPLLEKLRLQRVVFVNTASSSGAFLSVLAGPGRTIVTATKTGGERNETRFAEFFIEAMSGDGADRDRNGRVSVQEAFDYAKNKVVATYEQDGNLLSEHATLDDGAEGKLASTQFLAPQRSRTTEMANADPALRALVEQRDALERQIAELKLKKESIDAARYDEQLEKLLTELALKTRAIRDLEAKK